MLAEGQEVIYRRKGKEIFRLRHDTNLSELSRGLIGYLRYLQPFTRLGNRLTIPCRKDNGKMDELMTSEVRYVQKKGNALVIETVNSTYEIEYHGIDLERILSDGEWKGVNKDTKDWSVSAFPKQYVS